MEINISWSSYWTIIAVTFLLYYLVVLFLYYRNELLGIFQAKKNRSSSAYVQVPSTTQKVPGQNNPTANLSRTYLVANDANGLPLVQMLLDELSAYLDQAGNDVPAKEELLFSMKQVLKKYPVIQLVNFQEQINDFVQTTCKDKCSLLLEKDDLAYVWKG